MVEGIAEIVRPRIVSDGLSLRGLGVFLDHADVADVLPVLSLSVSCDPGEYVRAQLDVVINSCDLVALVRGVPMRITAASSTRRQANYSDIAIHRGDEEVHARAFRWTFDAKGPARLWLEGELLEGRNGSV